MITALQDSGTEVSLNAIDSMIDQGLYATAVDDVSSFIRWLHFYDGQPTDAQVLRLLGIMVRLRDGVRKHTPTKGDNNV